MDPVSLSQHASIRKQQRGIPGEVIERLLQFGKISHDHRGAEILHFDKRAKQKCISSLSRDELRKLGGHFDVYAVRGIDGMLLTVGHRIRKISRN